MFFFLFITLFFSTAYCSADLNVVFLEDSRTIYRTVLHLVRKYNSAADNTQKICITHYDDGKYLELDTLHDIHVVWCDIQMPTENGNETLERIKADKKKRRQATASEVRLPPFIAMTSLTEYHDFEDGIPSAMATQQGFISGRDKIQSIPEILNYTTRILEKKWPGENWLEKCKGIIPTLPKQKSDLEIEEVNEEFFAPEEKKDDFPDMQALRKTLKFLSADRRNNYKIFPDDENSITEITTFKQMSQESVEEEYEKFDIVDTKKKDFSDETAQTIASNSGNIGKETKKSFSMQNFVQGVMATLRIRGINFF